MSLSFEHVTDPEALSGLRDSWNTLLFTNHTHEVFLTWEWQTTWFRVYQPGDLWVILARDERGELVGIAPWFKDAKGQVIRPIGCVDVTDYLDVIVKPEYREAFFTGIASLMAQNCQRFSRINLCNHPDGSPTLELLPHALQSQNFRVNLKPQEVCPVIKLPDTFEGYLEHLDKKNRHELRRKMRRAEHDESTVAWYIVGAEHDLGVELEKFIHLMASSAPEKARFLQDPKNLAFFMEIMPQIAACGWLQLAFATVDGSPAAAYLNFDFDNRILVYNSGLILEPYGYLSLGIVLLANLIQHAIELHRSEFDFLRGNEEYKYRMGGVDRAVLEIQAECSA
ncbi:MAG: GNAT family N-acetyltransferase [Anaerolinea sp.]|nr:GNAT family N-acetyltransferase [Anaerolinea sp.]MCC6974072.1 GNAT family N-acetyltransferase [Anaerolineae bacterium]CAG0952286.1 hypothetical protein ANRL4_00151 [Anaerolineae bacterium]